jgi:hypothetical protein
LKKDALLNQIVTLAGDDRHLFVAPAITARPKKPTPISLSDLTQEVDKAHEAINAAEEHFQKWRHDDEHKDEKQSLKLYLAEYEPKVKEARERLNQLESICSSASYPAGRNYLVYPIHLVTRLTCLYTERPLQDGWSDP